MALKFPIQFIKWVMSCVTLVKFAIYINGEDCGVFKGGKGLSKETISHHFCLSYVWNTFQD